MEIIQLAGQCKEFLLTKDEICRPALPSLDLKIKPKHSFSSIKSTGEKILNKLKNSEIVNKFKPKKQVDNIDLAVISISTWRDGSQMPLDSCMKILTQVTSNLLLQTQSKVLDMEKLQFCIESLRKLKIILSKKY